MRLPVEVLEAVIDQASDDSSTLRDLSLTCATLLPRSRLHLFRNIVIKTEEQLWSSSEFLDSHPWLVCRVQKVTLWPFHEPEYVVPIPDSKLHTGLLDTAPIHLLSQLPNLHVWHMQGYSNIFLSLHHSTVRCYRQYGDHIRCLELYYTTFDRISDFKGLVSAFTRLDTLKCHWITFKYEHSGDSPVTGGKKKQSLSISNLLITTAVDSQAMEYLLVNSGSKLKNLTFTLYYLDEDYFERLEQSIILLTGLSSLVLALCPNGPAISPTSSDMLLFTAKILQQVHRRCLKDVQVEFITDSVADLANFLSSNSAQCKDFETAILSFPKVPVLVRDPVDCRRAGRAELWSPFIRRAFPNLNHQGLLALNFTPSKDCSPDPVGHESSVESLVFSPDSAQVITTSQDGTIIIWGMESGTVLLEWIAHDRGSECGVLALSPDGRRLVSSGRNTLTVWDIDGSKSAQKVAELEGHTDAVRLCAWSPDARLIASASPDGTVRIWDGQTYQQRDLLDFPSSHKPSPDSMKFSPDGRYLAWISDWENCSVWTPLAKEPPKILRPHPNLPDVCITTFAFDHESRCIATAHGLLRSDKPDPNPDACVVRIWDAATGALLKVLTGHSQEVSSVCFSADGRSLLSVSEDMDVRVWDCGMWSGEQVGVFGETDRESRVSRWTTCFRHDGRYMAASLSRGTVQVWRTGDGSCVATFSEYDTIGDVTRIEFSPNGQFLVSGDNAGIVHIRCISKYIDE